MKKMIAKSLVATALSSASFFAMASDTVTLEMIVDKIDRDMPRAIAAYCENIAGDPVFTRDPAKVTIPRHYSLSEFHEICQDNGGVADYDLHNFDGVGAFNTPGNQIWQLLSDATITFNNGHKMDVLIHYDGDSERGLKPFKEVIIPPYMNQSRN